MLIIRLIKNQNGQSLAEIVLAIAIFSILALSLVSLSLGGLFASFRGEELSRAQFLAQEGLEAVRSIKSRAWNELIYNSSEVSTSSGKWVLVGEGTSGKFGKFERTINFYPVWRDVNNQITSPTTTGAYLDVSSKRVESIVSWQTEQGTQAQVKYISYLTNWEASFWEQSNWQGGSGQLIWIDETKYYSDDGNININILGQVELALVATSTYATSSVLISSAFNTETSSVFCAIYWEEEISDNCTLCQVKFQIKTAPDSGGIPGAWQSDWIGPDGDDGDEDDYFTNAYGELISLDLNGDQWVKYKVVLEGDASSTPILKRVRIYYQ